VPDEALTIINLEFLKPIIIHESIAMPPRIPQVAIGQSRLFRLPVPPQKQQICLICSISKALPRTTPRRQLRPTLNYIRTRRQSGLVSKLGTDGTAKSTTYSSRIQLRNALADLQKDAAGYINISRLQLALRGLDQPPGKETIRVAILGQADGGKSLQKSKELLRLLVADPLKTEEEWERTLVKDQRGSDPTLLKIGSNGSEESIYGRKMVEELYVSSPILNGHNLEILVLEMDPPRAGESMAFTEAVLVPTMDIPTSSTGRYTQVTSPVHKSLIVSNGVVGAASALGHPHGLDPELVGTVVELKVGESQERSALPFKSVDISLGTGALDLFRQSISNAIVYEQGWFASGVPEIVDWIKSGTACTNGEMKEPLRKLVQSVVLNAAMAIEAEQVRQLSVLNSSKVSAAKLDDLREGLSKWAERAHTELRDQLDIAFEGNRWRKLGWWKLFWRVDDVSMIASEILSQRFLLDAEKEIIFVSGCIAEAGVSPPQLPEANWAYKRVEEKEQKATFGSAPRAPTVRELIDTPQDVPNIKIKPYPWPLQIPVTRAYLSEETVPALQALAQKLVLQTLSTSALASSFAGLMYLSSISTGLYEAGAVAALGTVWSLRRMQGQWETARKYWEGEVREEGRKAVRGVESNVGDLLHSPDRPLDADPELEKASEAVNRAKDALDMIR
jgi:hypothetical protein